VEASVHAPASDLVGELVAYLQDAHAIESQARQFLKTGSAIAGAEPLATAMRSHLSETEVHLRLVEERLVAHGAHASRVQDGALRIGGLSLAAFFAAQPDTPVKVAGFAYAFEHLELASYELLRRVADRAGDAETAAMAQRIVDEERDAAQAIARTWDAAMDAGLAKEGAAGG
jgi:ferritin-like metal-binding protein YciE